MNKNYLPVGSVVLLKGATKKIMVIGFYVRPDKNKEEVYDYIGCLYPEGIFSTTESMVFNHEQIDKVFYKGFENEEEKNFKEKLYEVIEKEKRS